MSRQRSLTAFVLGLSLIVLGMLATTASSQTYGQRPPDNQGYGPGPANVIPQGATIIARLTDTLDTNKIQRGKHFQAKLSEDLLGPSGNLLIPRDRRIKGHVSSVEQGLHARLLLSFDEIETRHGWVPLIATVIGVPGEHGLKAETGPEGEMERQGMDKRRTAESAAVGAAVGAVSGAAIGGGRGAAIGAAAGATLGGGAGILTDRNLRLEKGTQLEIRVDRPISVPLE
jgi:hypothetical protein